MKRILKATSRSSILALALLGLVAMAAGPALAAPNAPGWLPMQPMLAGNQLIAMWLPVPGAVKYIVYLNGQKVAESPANQYMALAPEKAGEYKYQVTAVDAAGAESPKSLEGIIKVVAVEPPNLPLFRVDDVEKSVQLRWNTPAGAVVYNIYKAESKDGPWNLLSSVQEGLYKDANLEYAKSYFYAISSKDTSGKESGKSPVVEVRFAKPKVVEKEKIAELRIIPTREIGGGLDLFGNEFPTAGLSEFLRTPGGRYFALFSDMILELDEAFNPVFVYMFPDSTRVLENKGLKSAVLKQPEGATLGWNIQFLNWIDDNTLLLVENSNRRIMELDLRRAQISWASKPLRKPTKEEDPKTFGSQLAAAAYENPILTSAVKLPSGNYWVCERNGNIWMEVNPKGDITRWWAYFVEGDAAAGEEVNEKQIKAAQKIDLLADGDLVIFTGLARHGYRIDPKTMRIKASMGASNPTDVGGFLGFGGWYLTPDKKYIVTADPAMGTVNLYDANSLDYLASFGSEEGKPDPEMASRPMATDFAAASYPILDKGGKRLTVLMVFRKYLSERDVLLPLPEPVVPAGKK